MDARAAAAAAPRPAAESPQRSHGTGGHAHPGQHRPGACPGRARRAHAPATHRGEALRQPAVGYTAAPGELCTCVCLKVCASMFVCVCALERFVFICRAQSPSAAKIFPCTRSHSQLAQPAIHPTLRQHFRTLWLALQGAMPTELLPWTLHRMGGPNLSHAQLASDPLAVLRQPRTVLQTPELLEIVLIILENYSFVSRAAAAEQASVVRQRTADAAERAVLMHTLLQAQEAAAVQLLIELCVPNKNEEPDPDVCAHVCRYIHAAFVGNPGLPRAILDAGFPPAALPVLVAGVPSLHVCLDFLPTLMEVDDLALQAFAVRVTGALAPAYPVPKALVAARAAFGRLHAATYLDPGARERFFECALPAVPLMCAAFPPLADAAAVLLVKLRNTEAAAAAGQMGGSSLSAGSTSLQQLLDVTFAQLAEKAILANALFM
eukprot:m.111679 g.111679  ORF g.111679 m.111679 type:complete len:435 (+) comp14358_c0_seq4:2203-3507(+)